MHWASNAWMLLKLLLIWESLLCKGLVNVEDIFSLRFSPAMSTVKARLPSPFAIKHMHHSLACLFKSYLELFSPETHLFSHEQLGKCGRQKENEALLNAGEKNALYSLQEAAPTPVAVELNPESRTRGMLPFKTHVPRLGAVIFICQPLNSKFVFFFSSKKATFSF